MSTLGSYKVIFASALRAPDTGASPRASALASRQRHLHRCHEQDLTCDEDDYDRVESIVMQYIPWTYTRPDAVRAVVIIDHNYT